MPIAPSQQSKLVVLLYMWDHGREKYFMQTKMGLVPVVDLQHARDYAASHGYSGIKVVPS